MTLALSLLGGFAALVLLAIGLGRRLRRNAPPPVPGHVPDGWPPIYHLDLTDLDPAREEQS